MKFTDEKFVLMALFMYALRRQTYAVGIAIENLKANWKELDVYSREQVVREIKDEALRDTFDKRSWNSFLEWVMEQKL